MKHRHYDLIRQWIEDTSKSVECSLPGGSKWHKVTCAPTWDENKEYRFAPDVLKYRVALFDTGAQRWTSTTGDPTIAANWEGAWPFVRWITDWTEVTEQVVEKPKMKKYERWLNLYPDGTCQVHRAKETADEEADADRVECRHIEWGVSA